MSGGVLEEIEGCHTHQKSKEQNVCHPPLTCFLSAALFVSFSFTSFVPADRAPETRVRVQASLDVFGGLMWRTFCNHRIITVVEQAEWALFLKSFFEISEAIPWPRDHILFTFLLPTTQATLAKFTKEDPYWKIRLIPD